MSPLERFSLEAPSAVAIIDGARSLTWEEWNRESSRLADALAGCGIAAGDRVGVRMMNRLEWFVVDAALAKLGAVRAAIAWRLSPPEARYILGNSGAKALFFDDADPRAFVTALAASEAGGESELGLLVSVEPATLPVVSYAELLDSGRNVERRSQPPRSIVYTSGTTGRPKGVPRSRPRETEITDAFRAMNDDLRRSIPYLTGDRNLLVAPLNHAAAPTSAFGTHSRGGVVVVERRFDAEGALALIEKHRITVSFLVPTMLGRIARLPESVRSRYDVSSIRVITTGASVCPGSLKREITAIFGPRLYESYGSTETGIVTLLMPEHHELHADSCGRLLDGCDVRIIDDDGRVLPAGEVGQIYIRSPMTIGAYVGELAMDAEAVRDGYFTAGDVGRLTADGFLYILDRKKDMIVSGGVNVYPAEIERVLREHPAIVDVAVFGVPNADFGEEVKAVCERLPGSAVDERELLEFLGPRLADFKRPRSIEFADDLPRNAMGKVLKRELRAPYWAGAGRTI